MIVPSSSASVELEPEEFFDHRLSAAECYQTPTLGGTVSQRKSSTWARLVIAWSSHAVTYNSDFRLTGLIYLYWKKETGLKISIYLSALIALSHLHVYNGTFFYLYLS